MKAIIGVFFLLLCSCQARQVKSSAQVANKKMTLEDILKQKTTAPSEIVNWLKKCSKECLHPDAEIANDLAEGYEVLFTLAAQSSRYEKLNDEQRKKAQIAQNKVKDGFVKILKFKNGRDILQTAYQELSSTGSMYSYTDPDFENLIEETIQRLKNEPQTRATGFYIQAISIPALPENLLKIIESYRECYIVSGKKDQACFLLYTESTSYYERPRCQEKNFHTGIQFIDQNSHKTILNTHDLLEANLEKTNSESGERQWDIWFSLKTFSSEKIEKYSQQQAVDKKQKNLILKFKSQSLSTVSLKQIIKDGQFRVAFPNEKSIKSAFAQICKKPTPNILPNSLKIK